MANVKSVHNEQGAEPSAEPCPTFGLHPTTSAADFNFPAGSGMSPF